MSDVIEALASFPYWSELITVLGSLAAAQCGAKRAYRTEVSKSYREQQAGAYEELRKFINNLGENPSFLLSSEYSIGQQRLDNHLRIYASPEVVKAAQELFDQLDNQRLIYAEKKADFEKKYMSWAPVYDEDRIVDYDLRLSIDPNDYDYEFETLANRCVIKGEELSKLTHPVLKAMRESISVGESINVLSRLKFKLSSFKSRGGHCE